MDRCHAAKLCVDRAGLHGAVGTGEGDGGVDSWRSLRSGYHLLKEGGLPAGEVSDAGLGVLFEILKSSRKGGKKSEVPSTPCLPTALAE